MKNTLCTTQNFYGARDKHIFGLQNGLCTDSEIYLGVVTCEMGLESQSSVANKYCMYEHPSMQRISVNVLLAMPVLLSTTTTTNHLPLKTP